MRHRIALLLLAALPFAFAGVALPQTPSPSTGAAPANAAPAGGAAASPYVMTMGDMMNTLIQPRHTKLGVAGKAESWDLAAYAESPRNLRRLTQSGVPRLCGGNPRLD